MNMKHLFFLLTMPLCCLAETGKTPAHDYKMVAFNNGLTAELIVIGPTSITFSVERSLDLERDEVTWVSLVGKLDIEKKGWYQLTNLDFEQLHGKATFEIPYSQLLWYDVDEYKSAFQERAWFALLLPFDQKDNTERAFMGIYSECDNADDESEVEIDEFRAKVLAREAEEHREERERFAAAEAKRKELVSRLVHESNEERFAEWARLDAAGATEEEKKAATDRLVAEFEQRLADALARLAAEEAEGETVASPPNRNHLWLYAGILLGTVCIVFYFLRRKK
jgi:hypothetical protein